MRLLGIALLVGVVSPQAARAWGDIPEVPSRWRAEPEVVWKKLWSGCLRDSVRIGFAVPVEGESPVRITITASPVRGRGPALEALVWLEDDGMAVASWRASGERSMRPGVEYAARVCAEDPAGNSSCARELVYFTAPEASSAPVDLALGSFEQPPTAMQLPHEERLEPALLHSSGWEWAGAGGLLVVLALGVILGLQGAARRRLSRVA